MNEKEREAIAWLGYAIALTMLSAWSIQLRGPEPHLVFALVLGLFVMGWKASRISQEHQAARIQPTKASDEEEEKRWQSYLIKRGPLE